MVHVSMVIEEHSRGECVTHLWASVRGLSTWYLPEWALSLRRLLRSGCVVENSPESVQEPRSAERITAAMTLLVPCSSRILHRCPMFDTQKTSDLSTRFEKHEKFIQLHVYRFWVMNEGAAKNSFTNNYCDYLFLFFVFSPNIFRYDAKLQRNTESMVLSTHAAQKGQQKSFSLLKLWLLVKQNYAT